MCNYNPRDYKHCSRYKNPPSAPHSHKEDTPLQEGAPTISGKPSGTKDNTTGTASYWQASLYPYYGSDFDTWLSYFEIAFKELCHSSPPGNEYNIVSRARSLATDAVEAIKKTRTQYTPL